MSIVLDSPAQQAAKIGADIAPLVRLLDRLRRQIRRWIWIESLAMVCVAGAALFWGSLLCDWLLEPPSWVRGLWAVATGVGLAILLRGKLFARLATPLEDASLATLVERGHASFRDSLSTAIELSTRDAKVPTQDSNVPTQDSNVPTQDSNVRTQGLPGQSGDNHDEKGTHDRVDRRLLDRTIREALAVVDEVRPHTLLRGRRLMALAMAGAAALASIGGLAWARPAIADMWVRRMALFSDEQWPRRARLSLEGFVEGRRKVARGSDVDIIVKADARHEIPAAVDLRSRGSAGWRSERMGMRGGIIAEAQSFGHVLKGVTEDLLLEVRGADARLQNFRIVVVDAPALDSLQISYTLPDYLGGGIRRASASRIVQIPRGSCVDIVCTSTKPLAAAKLLSIADGKEESLATLADQSVSKTHLDDRRIAARLENLSGDCTIVLQLTDTDGLIAIEPITFVLSALPDEAPQVSIRLRGISTAVTARARLPLVGTMSDDHGLAQADVRLHISVPPQDGTQAAARETILPIARMQAGAALIDLSAVSPEIVLLEPLGLASPSTLTVGVTAVDGCTLDGRPNSGSSDIWSLDVVTVEALTAMLEAREILLRRRFESSIADLTQARDRLLPRNDASTDTDRLSEAASRAAGETGEIADAFGMIHLELDNNQLLTPELETRLLRQIADPLFGLATKDLPRLAAASRGGATTDPADLVRHADDVLARMRTVLDKMMELESFNEVVEILRGVIRTQEGIRSDTLRRQKQRAREALERP